MAYRIVLHTILVLFLTVISQVGGVAWLIAVVAKRRLPAFILAYACLTLISIWTAPLLGREPLSCSSDERLQVRSWVFCGLNRHYVSLELGNVARDLALHMEQKFPGTKTVVLDGNFPFMDGFPLLPHLSHSDGRKLDLAFYYQDQTGTYRPGQTRSPLGYFAFEKGPTNCPKRWLSLRWDMTWLQPLWKPWRPDPERMRAALNWLSNDPRVGKIFIEPHLRARFNARHGKVRFQGCRAARHDDHIHIQL